MKYRTAVIAVIASSLLSVPVMAQETSAANTANTATDAAVMQDKDINGKSGGMHGGKRGPVDLEKFSRMDGLEAADTNGDGVLSREEIEAFVQKRIVKRAADRMERRLDINGDGKVTLAEIEAQRKKEFAALDRNDDGKIDRSEFRAAHMGRHGKGPGKGPGHGPGKGSHRGHHKGHHNGGDHKGPIKSQDEKPQE